jgi:spore coat polysaccharide biosynthesis protein SpsF (cytidylyltransferase family)
MSKQHVVALIQARMGSTRLPGKVLMDICGQPVIWHIWQRLKSIPELDEVVVATSTEPANVALTDYCAQAGIPFFRGNENNVLDRFYWAGKERGATVLMRVTGDCPLIDPGTSQLVLRTFLSAAPPYDYVATKAGVLAHQALEGRFPDGTDTEVFSFAALERAWRDASEGLDKGESVTSYIWRNTELFRVHKVAHSSDLGRMRWTLDQPEDLEFVRRVYAALYRPGRVFGLEDIVSLLQREPALAHINQQWVGQEKYGKYYQVASGAK